IAVRSTQFLHLAPGSTDAFALALADRGSVSDAAGKIGVETAEIESIFETIENTEGDLVIMAGSELSPAAQAAIASSAGSFGGEGRRVLLHPLPLYNNSVGAIDILPEALRLEDVLRNSKALYITGSLQDPAVLADKDFVVVQELFETETTEFADVVFPAASFAEVDGTFTN